MSYLRSSFCITVLEFNLTLGVIGFNSAARCAKISSSLQNAIHSCGLTSRREMNDQGLQRPRLPLRRSSLSDVRHHQDRSLISLREEEGGSILGGGESGTEVEVSEAEGEEAEERNGLE
jgi:hypothetical protein